MATSGREHESAGITDNHRLAERILLVGWDGAESGTIARLLAAGNLPHLSRLISGGAVVNLDVPPPVLAPAAWTTLATGRRAHEHGILEAFEHASSRPVPISRLSRSSSPIWNILHRAGLRAHVIGWPVTHPAEPISGVYVSDRFAAPISGSPSDADGPTILPTEVESAIRSRRVTPMEIEEVTIAQLLPGGAAGFPHRMQLEAWTRAILAEAATLFRAFRWCIGGPPWDFAACVFPGIRRCHELAAWMKRTSPGADELSEQFLIGCYEHHDLLLGQLIDQAGEHTHVVAIALTGHMANPVRQVGDSEIIGSTQPPSRDIGMAIVAGPYVRRESPQEGHSLLDVVPTILAMLGVPYGGDMSGRPLVELFDADLSPHAVDTWEVFPTTEVPQGPIYTEKIETPQRHSQRQSVDHLIALGYSDPDVATAIQRTNDLRRIRDCNRATSLMAAGLYSQAISTLETLAAEFPHSYQTRAMLADAYYRDNQRQAARREVDWLMCRGTETPQLYYLLASIEYADRQYDRALDDLQCASRAGISMFGARTLEGNVQMRRQHLAEAEVAFRTAIETEGPTPQSLDGLAAVNLHLGRFEEAAENALDALGQQIRFGLAHYHLAVALCEMGRSHEARRALETWAAVEPLSAAPYHWLARICERLHDESESDKYRRRGRDVVRQRRAAAKSTSTADT